MHVRVFRMHPDIEQGGPEIFRNDVTDQATASSRSSLIGEVRVSIFDMRETWDEIWRSDKYKDPQSRWEKVSYKIALFQKLGANLSELRAVGDIGCGAGYFAKCLLHIMKGSILAMDISPVSIDLANQLNNDPDIDYEVGDALLPWPVRQPLNAVFLVGLIEHVRRPEAVIRHAYDSLIPGGELYICSSHKRSVFHLEKWVLETFKRWRLGYQKDYETRELIDLLAGQGFNVKHHCASGCIRRRSLLSVVDRFLSQTLGWGRYIFLIAERK